jgi:hypothetical protein
LRVGGQDRRGEGPLLQLLRRRGDSLVAMLREDLREGRGRGICAKQASEYVSPGPTALTASAFHSSFRIRAMMRNPESPSGSITAASPPRDRAAGYGDERIAVARDRHVDIGRTRFANSSLRSS